MSDLSNITVNGVPLSKRNPGSGPGRAHDVRRARDQTNAGYRQTALRDQWHPEPFGLQVRAGTGSLFCGSGWFAVKGQERFQQPGKMFVVAILCKYGRGRHGNTYYGRWMASGINEDRRGRFQHTTDRSKATKFAKLTAESLVERLRKGYRLTAKVEPE